MRVAFLAPPRVAGGMRRPAGGFWLFCALLGGSAGGLFLSPAALAAGGPTTNGGPAADSRAADKSPPAESTRSPKERAGRPVGLGVDRAVVRFHAPETGGVNAPHFVFERELAFEARLVALADPAHPPGGEPFRNHHLQAALERHIAETLLTSLPINPEPTAQELQEQQELARLLLQDQVGGEAQLIEAARAEGMGSLDLRRMLRRRARASLYLDRMVAPMLVPSLLTLRRIHAEGKTPFSDREFSVIEAPLRRYTIARNLNAAFAAFYQNARARLSLEILSAGD